MEFDKSKYDTVEEYLKAEFGATVAGSIKNCSPERNGEYVFAVRYTLDVNKKQFYPFYALGYKLYEDRIEFFNTKVPGTIAVGAGLSIAQYGQVIKPPILDKKLATIFMYKTKKPKWFDLIEEEVVKSLETNTDVVPYQSLDNMLEPLLNQVIKKI